MGLLKRILLGGAAGVVVGGFATGAVLSCQLLVSPEQFYDSKGITSLVTYPSVAAAPTQLFGAGDYLFYVEGTGIYRIPKAGGTDPSLVRSFANKLTSIAFDGEQTIAYCADGALAAFQYDTLAPVTLAAGAGCSVLAIDGQILAYVGPNGDLPDAARPSTTVADRSSGASQTLTEDGGGAVPIAISVFAKSTYVLEGMHLFVTVGGQSPNLCDYAKVGLGGGLPCADPKVVLLIDAGAQPVSLVMRGEGCDLKRVELPDPVPPDYCCPAPTLQAPRCTATYPLPQGDPTGTGDFASYGGYFYWSQAGNIQRVAAVNVAPNVVTVPQTVVSISGGNITALSVDDTNVYFVGGNQILRAPLPPPPND